MGATVGHYVIERLVQWGIKRIYGYPGDGINGIDVALPDFKEQIAVHPGAARGDGGVHGVRARQVHRRARRLPRDLGAGRDSPAQRAVRRQARSSAGRRHRRPGGDDLDGRRTTSRKWICSTSSRTSPANTCTTVMSPAALRHSIDRAIRIARAERTVTCVIIPKDLQEEKMVAPPHKHGGVVTGIGFTEPRVVPHDARPQARRRRAQRGQEGRDARRRRRAARGRGGRRGRRPARGGRGQGAARQGGAARRAAVGHRSHRAARHQAELGPHDGVRHAAHGRHRASPTRSSCRRRGRRAASRSTSTGACSACAIRWR